MSKFVCLYVFKLISARSNFPMQSEKFIPSKGKNMMNKVLPLAQRKAQVLLLSLEFKHCRDIVFVLYFSNVT